jgi:hypothetical protein
MGEGHGGRRTSILRNKWRRISTGGGGIEGESIRTDRTQNRIPDTIIKNANFTRGTWLDALLGLLDIDMLLPSS